MSRLTSHFDSSVTAAASALANAYRLGGVSKRENLLAAGCVGWGYLGGVDKARYDSKQALMACMSSLASLTVQ